MEYFALEDYIFDLRDECHEYMIQTPDSIPRASVQPLEADVNLACEKLQAEYRIPELQGVSNFWDAEFPEIIHATKSMVGDDETAMIDRLMHAILCMVTGPIFAQIKVSWTDVQFDRELYNYAEEWILVPPSTDSSFESVTRYAKNGGVPYVLDPMRFRNLSAVREQSDLEVDLPSKMRKLSQSAARKIFQDRKGQATKGTLGVMADINNLQKGIEPGDALFAKNLALALGGDARWLDIRAT